MHSWAATSEGSRLAVAVKIRLRSLNTTQHYNPGLIIEAEWCVATGLRGTVSHHTSNPPEQLPT
jgi:hypothetical protein